MNFMRCLSLIFCAFMMIAAAKSKFIPYEDEAFHYRVDIPSDWKKSVKNLKNKHILNLEKGGNANIVISASKLDDKGGMVWDNWKDRYLKGFGTGLLKIIATRELAVGTDILCKILVFEHRQRSGRILQRAMLLKHGDDLLLIECRAPTGNFSRNTETFNTVMASVNFLGASGTGKAIELKKEEKIVPEPDVKTIIEYELRIIEKLERLGLIEKIE